ncbi:DUF4442 domain-containing protein [Allokutzneria albata]|uniref:Acyl-coenzyme A thioesterase PaaI, contains HGG motif n=1 Tax=Allokutzneria albata TaxID=211114 RepID=A0A1H0AL54_ALLAB|nr:DUF4442 domain-containing protein [Allokutzneria albata]SDN33853.1 protein of unknown function [Allokutzneria albata]
MSVDTSQVGEMMRQMVPWVRNAGIQFLEAGPEKVVVELPDLEDNRNHVGGPHAAMMFGAAETASGALVAAAFIEQLAIATPLPTKGEITYAKLARGRLTATAVLGRPAAEAVAELAAGVRPDVPVHVTISNAEGVETGRLDIIWTLKPHAKD